MTVNILLITHDDLGQAFLKIAQETFGELPLPVTAVTVNDTIEIESLWEKLRHFMQGLTTQEGVLILTDLFGATPCNLARKLANIPDIRVVSGLNLPMLLRVLNYADLPLLTLAEKAISGGKEGVIDCSAIIEGGLEKACAQN